MAAAGGGSKFPGSGGTAVLRLPQERMHIWMINHYAVPATEAGGTRHYSLARELVSRGHKVSIISSAFRHARNSSGSLGGASNATLFSELDGVQFVQVPTPAYSGNGIARIYNMLAFAWRVLRIGRDSRLPRPNVVIGSSPHLFAAIAARRVARNAGAAFVLEIRDLWPSSLVKVAGLSPHHPLVLMFGKMERSLYRSADAIVSLLPEAKSHIVTRGGDAGRIVWIPNGVDFKLVGAASIAPERARGTFTIMYTGTMGRANAMESLLETAALVGDAVPGARFRFIGDGPERRRLQTWANRIPLTNVSFEEPVPKQALFSTLREADVFLVSTRDLDLYQYGLSLNKLFDYLAVGRPIVFGADCPSNPVLDAHAGIVVPPEDSLSMSDAIVRLYHMTRCERDAMGQRGRRFAEEHHNIERLAERLEELCQSVADRP